jgi:tetratricopeptide (TPR) repeat protein
VDERQRSIPSHQTAINIAAWLVEGFTLHQAGRLDEAERLYERILAAYPDHSESLYLLGAISSQRGDHAEALSRLDRALQSSPDNAPILNQRGLALTALERRDEALASYDRALALNPGYAEVLANRGAALQALQRFAEALESYDRALQLGFQSAELHYNRGSVLFALQRWPDAVDSFDRALALNPRYAEALANRGSALQAQRRFTAALASYDAALELGLENVELHSNRGVTLNALKRFDEALVSLDRALAMAPDRAEVHSSRAGALCELDRFEEGLAGFDHALTLQPDLAEAHANRAVALLAKMRLEEALLGFERALALKPDFAHAHYTDAVSRLLTGDLALGFEKYEWRWRVDLLECRPRDFAQPQWLGTEDVAGKTILLHADHGYGDAIQFCRYAPLVAARGARVILETHRPLRRLMGTLAGVAQVFAGGEALPDFDLHCPLLSLPWAFRTELATIPAATPYLGVDGAAAMDWGTRLGPRQRPRIGLVWCGNPNHDNDRRRSIALSAMLPLVEGIDATFVSLQRDLRPGDAELLQNCGAIVHFGEQLKDFADTAALVANLDLVISVDTSVAHLAGALGKPVWIMLPYVPEWRWLLDREDSPWYPTARLFRQDESRSWDGVIARVRTALAETLRAG